MYVNHQNNRIFKEIEAEEHNG